MKKFFIRILFYFLFFTHVMQWILGICISGIWWALQVILGSLQKDSLRGLEDVSGLRTCECGPDFWVQPVFTCSPQINCHYTRHASVSSMHLLRTWSCNQTQSASALTGSSVTGDYLTWLQRGSFSSTQTDRRDRGAASVVSAWKLLFSSSGEFKYSQLYRPSTSSSGQVKNWSLLLCFLDSSSSATSSQKKQQLKVNWEVNWLHWWIKKGLFLVILLLRFSICFQTLGSSLCLCLQVEPLYFLAINLLKNPQHSVYY